MGPDQDFRYRCPKSLNTLLVAWATPILLLYSGLVVYDGIDLYSESMVFAISCLFVFASGYIFAKKHCKINSNVRCFSKCSPNYQSNDIEIRIISILATLGILSGCLFAIEMIFVNRVSFGDIGNIRNVFLNKTTTPLSQFAAVLGSGSFVAMAAAVFLWPKLNPRQKALWILSPFFISLISFLSGGRQTLFQIVLFLFFAFRILKLNLIFSKKFYLYSTSIIALVLSVFFTYGAIASAQRNDRAADISKKELIEGLFRVEFHPSLNAALEDLPDPMRDGLAEGMVYFTHSIPFFTVFWGQPSPGPYGGLWEFPFLARRFDDLGLTSLKQAERMDYVYSKYAVSGRFPQVWQTQLRDMIIDFTPLGTFLGMVLWGIVCGRLERLFLKHGGLWCGQLLVGLNVACVYSIMFSMVSDTIMFFYFINCGILFFLFDHRKRRLGLPLLAVRHH